MYAVLQDDDSRTRCRKTAQRREKKKRSGLSRALKPKLSYFRQENHMLYLGCHLSISKGYHKAAQEAVSIGANTFQFFTRNPRGGNAKALDEKDIAKAKSLMEEYAFGPLLAHAPYTMNLCSAKEDVREFALTVLKEDVERMKYLPEARFLFHPGSHVGQGAEQGIQFIVDALNETIKDDDGPMILLEGMSGKGSEIGRNFDEIAPDHPGRQPQ